MSKRIGTALEEKLEEQVERIKELVGSLPITSEQKTNLRKNIYEMRFVVTSFPLSQERMRVLNKEITECYKTYDNAYREAKECLAVSEWMSDPVDIVYDIWKSIV